MKFGYTINNKLMMNSNGKLIGVEVNDPYNPLNLPQGTIRVRTNDWQPPVNGNYTSATLVDGTTDVYDVYSPRFDWTDLLKDSTNVVEVLGANTQGKPYKVNNMNSLFDGCTSLTSVAFFDTSNVEYMGAMFNNCTSLTTIPLFDTHSVIRMGHMFRGCASLNSVPLFNTSRVTDMQYMFEHCTSLTTVPLFDTSKVTKMMGTFGGCTKLSSIPLFNTSNVTNMSSMFANCYLLTSVPLFNTSNVTTMNGMFAMWDGVTSLRIVPLFNTSKVTNMHAMLFNCTKVESGSLALYIQASTQTTPPTTHTRTFYRCGVDTQTGSAELAQIPDDWK